MRILLDIPDNEIPEKQEVVTTYIHFIDREVCEVGHYCFMILPKEHGDLIDRDELKTQLPTPIEDEYKTVYKIVDSMPSVIEADRGDNK